MSRREKYKKGRIRVWVIEEKWDDQWITVKMYRGADGPKAKKGQRVRLLKKEGIQEGLTSSKQQVLDEEINNSLEW